MDRINHVVYRCKQCLFASTGWKVMAIHADVTNHTYWSVSAHACRRSHRNMLQIGTVSNTTHCGMKKFCTICEAFQPTSFTYATRDSRGHEVCCGCGVPEDFLFDRGHWLLLVNAKPELPLFDHTYYPGS